jgi:hypothetical protein
VFPPGIAHVASLPDPSGVCSHGPHHKAPPFLIYALSQPPSHHDLLVDLQAATIYPSLGPAPPLVAAKSPCSTSTSSPTTRPPPPPRWLQPCLHLAGCSSNSTSTLLGASDTNTTPLSCGDAILLDASALLSHSMPRRCYYEHMVAVGSSHLPNPTPPSRGVASHLLAYHFDRVASCAYDASSGG